MHSVFPLLPLSVSLSQSCAELLQLALGPLAASLALRAARLEALEFGGQILPLFLQHGLGLLQGLTSLKENMGRHMMSNGACLHVCVSECVCVPLTLLLLSSCSWRLSMAALCLTLSSDSWTSWRRVSSSTHRWRSFNSASRRDLRRGWRRPKGC